MLSIARLLAVAAASRALYLALFIALDAALPDYDTSGSLASADCDPGWPARAAAARASASAPGPPGAAGPAKPPGLAWDAVFFHRVAACGYEYEQFYAFFPGFPAVARALAPAARALGAGPGPVAGFTAAGLALNAGLFLLTTAAFARLSQEVLRDDRLAAAAALLFIFNPASVFHAAPYSEAAFFCATCCGLWALYCVRSAPLAAAAFAASAAVRSNGLLNGGFLLHEAGRRALAAWPASKPRAAVAAASGAALAAAVAAPYLAFQRAGWLAFCGDSGSWGHDKAAAAAAGSAGRPWCGGKLPSIYGFVQRQYWDVGFLRYYRLKQAPNFLLAAPALLLSAWGVAAYARAQGAHFWTGGLLGEGQLRQLETWLRRRRGGGNRGGGKGNGGDGAENDPSGKSGGGESGGGKGGTGPAGGALSRAAAVFVIHWAAMALVAALVMHVQVATRFLSAACPPVYCAGRAGGADGNGGGSGGGGSGVVGGRGHNFVRRLFHRRPKA